MIDYFIWNFLIHYVFYRYVFFIYFSYRPDAALLWDATLINLEDIKENLHVIPINTTT